MIQTLTTLIPDIQNAHKKTPVEIRLNAISKAWKIISNSLNDNTPDNTSNNNTNLFKQNELSLIIDFIPVC